MAITQHPAAVATPKGVLGRQANAKSCIPVAIILMPYATNIMISIIHYICPLNSIEMAIVQLLVPRHQGQTLPTHVFTQRLTFDLHITTNLFPLLLNVPDILKPIVEVGQLDF